MVLDKGPQISGAAYSFLTLAWVSTILRIYCRACVVKSFGSDDWLALVATIFYTVYCAFSIKATHYGSGKLTADISSENLPLGLEFWWLCEPVYVMSALLIKLSIALFLLRICIARMQKVIIWVTTASIFFMSVGYLLMFIFQCAPSSYFWTRYAGATSGSCLNTDIIIDMSYVYSSISCLVDWILGLLPINLVWNLQMDSKTKISVAAILAIGAIASTATIVRIPYLSGLTDEKNFLYSTAGVAVWSTVETGIAITSSSLATLRPLFRNFLDGSKIQSSLPHSRTGYMRNTNGDTVALKLRTDGIKSGTVTTTIKAGSYLADDDIEYGFDEQSSSNSEGTKFSGNADSRNKIHRHVAYERSEDSDWGRGITKTTVISNV